MRYILVSILMLILFATGGICQMNKPEQVITELKPLYRETTIVSEGDAQAVIVIPDDTSYRELADAVQTAIADATGAELPIVVDDAVDIENPPQHLIVIGNMDTNVAAEWLYWRRYVACDLDYPGPDGYVVRTACDPWGTGINAIMLGGSDMDGIRAAVEAFPAHITPGETLTLPMLRDIHMRDIETIDEAALEEDWEYYRQEIIEAGGLWYQVETKIFRLAYDYYLTGVDEYAEMYAAVLPRWFEEYYRFTPHRQLTTPKYQMPDMFRAFDLVEESPAMTDELRLEMSNLLLDYAIRMGQGGRVHNWQPGEMRLGGHIPILSVLYGYQYFTKHYPDQPMELLHEGMDDVRTALDSYTHSVGFMTETGYLCFHPEMIMYYSQATGDRRWYETGNALEFEKYHLLVTDNYGTALGKWTPVHMMAARVYEDGRWLWLSNFQRHDDDYTTRIEKGKFSGPRWMGRPGIEPVVPEGLAGLRVFNMTEKWHTALQEARGELAVPSEEAFNQMAMRRGYDRNDQYMRIPGVNVGFHYGTPANAIVSMFDKGRNWLVNGRWGMSLPKYYNTMLVVKDGQTYTDLPYLCRLLDASDLQSAGFFQSELPDYTGTDWTRSVVWNKGRYWLVFDNVEAKEDGEYTAMVQWRVGRNSEPELSDGQAVAERSGKAVVIETPDASTKGVVPEGPEFGDTSSWIYRQGRTESLSAGESVGFSNLLWVRGGSRDITGWDRWQSNAETALVVDGGHSGDRSLKLVNTGDTWRCLMQKLDLQPGETYRVSGWARTNGEVTAVIQIRDDAAQQAVMTDARTDAQEWTKLEFDFQAPAEGGKPELWLLHHHYNSPGGIAWFDDLSVTPVAGGENVIENPGFEGTEQSRRMSAEYAVRGLDDGCVIVSDGSEYWVSGASGDGSVRKFQPAEGVSVTARAFQIGEATIDLADATALELAGEGFDSDAPVDLSINLDSGRCLARTSKEATVLFTGIFQVLRDQGDLAVDQDGVTIPAGEWPFRIEAGPQAALLDAESIWEAARKPGRQQEHEPQGEAMTVAGMFDGGAEVNAITRADIDGDGALETIAGLEDGTTVAIDAGGTELFRHSAEGAINAVHCVDLTGDGTPDVLSGSDDFSLYALDAAGQVLWEFTTEDRQITRKLAGNIGTGRYVSSEGEFISIETADIDGDGTVEILAGAKAFMHGNRRVYGTLWVVSTEGEPLWHVFNFGGTLDSIDAADIDGDGELEIAFGTGGGTYGQRAYTVQPGGELIAEIAGSYGEKRVAFAQLEEGGETRLVRLERTDGTVAVFPADGGDALWTYPTSGVTSVGPFVRDFDGDGLDEIAVAGASGDVYMLEGGKDHLAWRTNVGGPISAMDVATVDGSPVIVVGTFSGQVFALDPSGGMIAHGRVPISVASIAADSAGAIVAGLSDGTVALLQM